MEIKSIVVEARDSDEVFPNFCTHLEQLGFEDVHENTVQRVCQSLKEILEIDFLKRKSFKKSLNSFHPHLFINTKMKSVILVAEPEEVEFIKGKKPFEVTCFSKSQKDVHNQIKTLKELLAKEIGLSKKEIHDGDLDEVINRNFINSLSETYRTGLIRKVEADALRIFVDGKTRMSLKRLTNLPVKVFSEELIIELNLELNPNVLVSSRIMKEYFAPRCTKCGEGGMSSSYLCDSKERLLSVLKETNLFCQRCGYKLDSEFVEIESLFRFTDLGLECAKGLWLEAYVRSILEKLGIKGENIKSCVVHGKDELDHIFADCDDLYVCECRDRTVGRNDVYVLAMKVSRIEDDESTEASVDKVLIISTEPISKDIVSSEKEMEIKYIPISDDSDSIAKNVEKLIKKSRTAYKRRKMKDLSELMLSCIPSTPVEIPRILRDYYY